MANPASNARINLPINPDFDALHVLDVKGDILSWIDSKGVGRGALSVPAPVISAGSGWFNVKDYGAKGDTKKVLDAVGVVSGNHVTSATAKFTAADVGKTCWLISSGNGALMSPAQGTILSINSSTDVTVSSTIAVPGSSAAFTWGTDDTAAVQAAVVAAKAVSVPYNTSFNGGPCATVFFPFGGYILNAISTIAGAYSISVSGAGMYDSILYIGPGFPYHNTGAGNVITQCVEMTDFTLDGGNVSLAIGNILLIDVFDFMRRVRVYNWLAATGSNNTAVLVDSDDCALEDININVLPTALGIHTLQLSILRASLLSSEYGMFVADTSNIRVLNSFINVGGSGTAVIEGGTSPNVLDLTFVNCKIISAALAVDLIEMGSIFRFNQCWVIGATPFSVISGGTIYCGSSTVTSTNTNAVNNSGDFWDLGGNIFTGAKAGGGTYHTAQFA